MWSLKSHQYKAQRFVTMHSASSRLRRQTVHNSFERKMESSIVSNYRPHQRNDVCYKRLYMYMIYVQVYLWSAPGEIIYRSTAVWPGSSVFGLQRWNSVMRDSIPQHRPFDTTDTIVVSNKWWNLPYLELSNNLWKWLNNFQVIFDNVLNPFYWFTISFWVINSDEIFTI